ncbi:MAG: hypothetical protein KF696_09375, partial [Planctomycetes bacterium]|nr:hypothetical protein [Planctomycetota bacterium]
MATTPGAAQNVYANDTGTGGNGRSVTRFTIAQGTQTGASLTNIQVQAAGTGDDSTAYTEVAIYRDDNSNNTFDFGTDVLIASHTAFPANNGTRDFAVTGSESTFTASQTKTYFLVVKLNGSPPASPGHTFNYVVSDITVSGTNAQKAGVPSGTINGLNILTPSFNFADVSPATATTVFLGSSNNVCQAFTIAYPNGPADKPASVTVTGLGSAHEVDDLTAVQLWYDSNANGTFEPGTDTQVASGTFSADNGTVQFSMASHANFTAGDTRRFFVIYNLNANASDNETFQCYVSSAGNGTHGGTPSGLPVPAVTGTPGLVVSANVLAVT